MSTEVAVTQDVKLIARAVQVQDELLRIKEAVQSNAVDLAFLLKEAHEFEYYRVLGANTFEAWVESSIELDMSTRQAFYLVGIAKKADKLGLTKEDLKKIKISKLKEIFSLDPSEHREEILDLIVFSAEDSLEEIKKRVASLKSDVGEEPQSFVKFKVPESVYKTLMDSFELCRKMYGSTVDSDGRAIDITDSKCLELIAVSFIQDVHNSYKGGQQTATVYNASFEVVEGE